MKKLLLVLTMTVVLPTAAAAARGPSPAGQEHGGAGLGKAAAAGRPAAAQVSTGAQFSTAGPASAAAQGAAAPGRERLFVGFAKTPGASERALVARFGGTVRHSFPSIDALAIELDSAKVSDLARAGGVRYVEQDPVRKPLSLLDLEHAQLVPDISNGLYGLVTTNAVAAHDDGFTGSGVKACVADTALDTGHPDIADNFVLGYNVFDGSNDVDASSLDVADTETHATHVSGILLGVDNSKGILGVAPGAQLYEARVLQTTTDHPGPHGSIVVEGSTSDVMAGVQWLADQGCRVINMSLGGGHRSRSEEMLYQQVTEGGTLIVAAAGNDARRKIEYPAAYPEVMSVGAVDVDDNLADFSNTGRGLDIVAPGVGVLSSVPMGEGRAALVNDGSTEYEGIGMEFAGLTDASGVDGKLYDCGIADTTTSCPADVNGNIALIERGAVTFAQKVADVMAQGAIGAIIYNNASGNFSGTLGTADNNGEAWIPAISVSQEDGQTLAGEADGSTSVTLVNAPTRWDFFGGTSMATPHVAGVAALVLGKNPDLSPGEVRDILDGSAMDLGTPGYDTTYGNGLVDATAALDATP